MSTNTKEDPNGLRSIIEYQQRGVKRPWQREPKPPPTTDELVEIIVFGQPWRCLRSAVPKTYKGTITVIHPN